MSEHGEFNKDTNKVYCNYWMTIEEWDDIHSYTINETPEQKMKEQNID